LRTRKDLKGRGKGENSYSQGTTGPTSWRQEEEWCFLLLSFSLKQRKEALHDVGHAAGRSRVSPQLIFSHLWATDKS
jgi:hypothetical protein